MSRPPLALAGHTAIVTGAGSGIGRALACRAAAEGMAVALCDVNAAGLAETARMLGDAPHLARVVDVAADAPLLAFAREMAQELPPPVLLFANAGVLRQGRILSMPVADWELLFAVNVLGTIRTLQAFAPTMDLPGQIVVTGSVGTMANHPGLGAYCATKHALWPVCEQLRGEMEEAGRPIGVSLLMPGAVATHIFDAANPDRETPADSISPDAAADIAFAGALANKALILTHPNFIPRAQARFEEALAALR